MILLAQQNGSGPIVSLGFGPSGAPAVLADIPLVSAVEPTDLLLISRNGQLMGIGSNELNGSALQAVAALAEQVAALPATGAEIAAMLQNAPAQLLAAINNIQVAGELPASNTGAGGGIFADGTFLSFGYAAGS